jgi:hypothetical protein
MNSAAAVDEGEVEEGLGKLLKLKKLVVVAGAEAGIYMAGLAG